MAIFGDFFLEQPKRTIRKMKVGEKAYVFLGRAFLTKRYFVIHLDSEIFFNKEWAIKSGWNFIEIERVGKGFSSNDFNLYLEVDPHFGEFEFSLIDTEEMRLKVRDTYYYLSFKRPPIVFIDVNFDSEIDEEEQVALDSLDTPDVYEELQEAFSSPQGKMKRLQRKLQEAIENEKYLEAAEIRDELSRLEKIQNKNKDS